MTVELQLKIKNNPNYIRYLREHSYWYKTLNRNPLSFKNFEEEVKDFYQLRPSDKISHALEALEMVQTLMSSFK